MAGLTFKGLLREAGALAPAPSLPHLHLNFSQRNPLNVKHRLCQYFKGLKISTLQMYAIIFKFSSHFKSMYLSKAGTVIWASMDPLL